MRAITAVSARRRSATRSSVDGGVRRIGGQVSGWRHLCLKGVPFPEGELRGRQAVVVVTWNMLRYAEFFFRPEAFFGILLKSALLGGENSRCNILDTLEICKSVIKVLYDRTF